MAGTHNGLWEPNKSLSQICSCQNCAGQELHDAVVYVIEMKRLGVKKGAKRLEAAMARWEKAFANPGPHPAPKA